MIEQGLLTLLQADPTLASLVGNRIYPVKLPDDTTYPCLSYQVVSGVSDYSFDGSAETQKRIQFDSWSNRSYSDVKKIQQALHSIFDGFAGPLSDGTQILGAFRGTEIDLFESDSNDFRSLTEYTFHYVE